VDDQGRDGWRSDKKSVRWFSGSVFGKRRRGDCREKAQREKVFSCLVFSFQQENRGKDRAEAAVKS
jgi:hypothetical protein